MKAPRIVLIALSFLFGAQTQASNTERYNSDSQTDSENIMDLLGETPSKPIKPLKEDRPKRKSQKKGSVSGTGESQNKDKNKKESKN